jgi:hypothetical protein
VPGTRSGDAPDRLDEHDPVSRRLDELARDEVEPDVGPDTVAHGAGAVDGRVHRPVVEHAAVGVHPGAMQRGAVRGPDRRRRLAADDGVRRAIGRLLGAVAGRAHGGRLRLHRAAAAALLHHVRELVRDVARVGAGIREGDFGPIGRGAGAQAGEPALRLRGPDVSLDAREALPERGLHLHAVRQRGRHPRRRVRERLARAARRRGRAEELGGRRVARRSLQRLHARDARGRDRRRGSLRGGVGAAQLGLLDADREHAPSISDAAPPVRRRPEVCPYVCTSARGGAARAEALVAA